MSKLKFSIVIACYNQEDFVKKAVKSALSQAYPEKEIIVVDDGSNDGTVEVLKSFGNSIILATQQTNKGVYTARNQGASLAKGEYLVFLDGDDVLMPWALNVYESLINARNPKIILGRAIIFSGKTPEAIMCEGPYNIQFVEYEDFLSKDRPGLYNTSALVVNRKTFWSVGGWTKGIYYQDIQDLLSKLGISGKMIFLLTPGTVWYRMHEKNAVRRVSLFIKGVKVLIINARSGQYQGAKRRWIDMSAWFGGLIYYWAKEAIGNGLYRDGIKLLAFGWWMVLLAIFRLGKLLIVGRSPVELLPLNYNGPIIDCQKFCANKYCFGERANNKNIL